MLEYHEKRIQELNIAHEQLQRQYLELTEKKHVLRETAVFFQQVSFDVARDFCIIQGY